MSAGEAQDYQRRRPSMGYEHAWIRGICRATESVSSQVSRGACFPPSESFATNNSARRVFHSSSMTLAHFLSIAQTEGEKATNAKHGDVGAKKNDSAGKLSSQVRIEKPSLFSCSTQHVRWRINLTAAHHSNPSQ